MSNVPAIFASILAQTKVDPLIKYRGTFERASAADVASIAQAKAFIPILMQAVAVGGIIAPQPMLVAQESGFTTKERFFSVDEMLADGFPDSQPCHLHLLFAKGEEQPEEDRGNGELFTQKNNNLMEVADAIRMWFTGGKSAVLNEVAR